MSLLKNKRGQLDIDTDIFQTPGFIILLALSWGATTMGYVWGKSSGMETFPIPFLLVIYAVEFIASYAFVARG